MRGIVNEKESEKNIALEKSTYQMNAMPVDTATLAT